MKDRRQDRPQGIARSTNRVGRASDWLGSAAFNEAPQPLHIWGICETNRSLFAMLARARDLPEAGEAFLGYMTAVFGIDPEQREEASGRRPFRSSFLSLIQGWSFDSNGPEGAVLKGWVESRFGLGPTFHKAVIEREAGTAWHAYVEEKMASRFHDNSIWSQLDLLFEFCQWAVRRFAWPGRSHLTLYRGANDIADRRASVVRLNNLVSFSSERSVADCFGDAILTAEVPLCKLVCFSGLLPSRLFRTEREFLVIGGDYRVSVDYV
ncbi:NAD(+)--dinitrogen-reductase ADP-D-ribosyltransferase (plasmid) [Cereibacter azotoformans]|uniref:NAD(+)--dinitrogen-reductase ADP-D-ribosyltransferase n=1 Tax=Cereibacter azotoformans TaxID=43057 RepID=UPI003B2112A6